MEAPAHTQVPGRVCGCSRIQLAGWYALTAQQQSVQAGFRLLCQGFCTAGEACAMCLVLTNVLVELSHEGLAEACDLSIGAALGVEVCASLSSSHGECGQTVLEDLLKAQELDDAQTCAGSES